MSAYRLAPGDYLIIIVFLLLGGIGIFYNITGATVLSDQKYIQIHVDNQLIKEVSIDKNENVTISFTFGEDNEHEGVLEYSDGRIRMLPLDKGLCPLGICSHTGWISQYGETIVCLPNRILIQFTQIKNDNENNVDGITK